MHRGRDLTLRSCEASPEGEWSLVNGSSEGGAREAKRLHIYALRNYVNRTLHGARKSLTTNAGLSAIGFCGASGSHSFLRERANMQDWHEINRRPGGLSFKHRYNISMDEVFTLFEKQGYSCALCGVTAARKWNLDHDHVTGRVRGILCSKCNNGLSALGDDLAGAEAAVDYLRNSCGE